VTVDYRAGKGGLQRVAARQAMDIGFVHQDRGRVIISRVTVEAEALKRVKSRTKTCINSFHGFGNRVRSREK
jgi:Glu-tRNA(Gln) amidotransferase subunit E-like FAD-binding protein